MGRIVTKSIAIIGEGETEWFYCSVSQKRNQQFRLNNVKLLHDLKYFSERSEFLRLYLYLCRVIQNFCLFFNAAQR